MSVARLSLCLIVRDEAELLPEFLTRVQGLWDELVAVDTGSRDETVALLRAAGARVIERAWDDDFAAARNAGLDQATGDWILVLDPDEMVSRELVAEVRDLLADGRAGAATLPMINLLPHGHRRETPLLRLFRRRPGVRFRHRIHEEVATSVQALLRAEGLELRHLRGPVTHLGYVRERAEARGKRERDRRVLERALAEDPGDLYSWFKLLELARFWQDAALASAAAGPALAALERAAAPGAVSDLAALPFAGELLVLAAQAQHPDAPARALALLAPWSGRVAPAAAFFLYLGELQERTGQPAAAAASFARCLELGDQTSDRQLAGVRPLMGLARLALAGPGDLERAWAFTTQALALNPRDQEALLCAVTICRSVGGQPLLDQMVAEHLSRHGDSAELRAALAAA